MVLFHISASFDVHDRQIEQISRLGLKNLDQDAIKISGSPFNYKP